MGNLYKQFESDSDLETAGIVIQFDGCSFKCKRPGGANKEFGPAWEEATRPYNSLINRNQMPRKLFNQLLAEVYADKVIVGWTNVEDRDGTVLEFTKENVVKILIDLPEVFRQIKEELNDYQSWLINQREVIVKNLSPPSDTELRAVAKNEIS